MSGLAHHIWTRHAVSPGLGLAAGLPHTRARERFIGGRLGAIPVLGAGRSTAWSRVDTPLVPLPPQPVRAPVGDAAAVAAQPGGPATEARRPVVQTRVQPGAAAARPPDPARMPAPATATPRPVVAAGQRAGGTSDPLPGAPAAADRAERADAAAGASAAPRPAASASADRTHASAAARAGAVPAARADAATTAQADTAAPARVDAPMAARAGRAGRPSAQTPAPRSPAPPPLAPAARPPLHSQASVGGAARTAAPAPPPSAAAPRAAGNMPPDLAGGSPESGTLDLVLPTATARVADSAAARPARPPYVPAVPENRATGADVHAAAAALALSQAAPPVPGPEPAAVHAPRPDVPPDTSSFPLQPVRLDEALGAPAPADLPLVPIGQAAAPAESTPSLPPTMHGAPAADPRDPPQSQGPDRLPATNAAPPPAEPDVGHVADRVYSLLVDRLSSERRLRGL